MRFDRLLAGTATALVLMAGASAHARLDGKMNADIPQIEPARLVITPADTGGAVDDGRVAPAAAPSENAAIPIPEPAEPVIAPSDIGRGPAAAPDRIERTETPISPAVGVARRTPAHEPPLLEPADVVITPADIAPDADKGATASIPVPATPLNAPATPVNPPAGSAVQQTATPAPAPALDPIAEKLRDALAAKDAERLFDRKTRASLDSFYAARKYAFVWSDNGAMNERAKAVAAQLNAADADGLDPTDYVAPRLAADASPEALADFELRLTDAVLTYARHAAVGRVHWSRVARDIVYEQTPPEAAEVLGNLATAADARKALDGYNPQHPAYKALKAKLAEARGGKKEDAPTLRIGAGATLKVGMKDDRVPDLRERLGLGGKPGDTTYDDALADAVKNFQKEKKLAANGRLSPATVDALNGKASPDHLNARAVDTILVNLERWRWMPHDLGKAHVIVNIPEFMLRVYNNGSLLWSTRVVVGKPGTPTPLLTETMKFITVNPTWNVPPSIVYGEYLPALQQDPTVLARMGLRVSYNRGGGIHISQPPGASNALGRIRFNFPNKFLVYQHDTPDKHLFAHDRRAYSHGCMRVQDPDKYAEALLSIALPKENYTADRIRRMYGSGEVNINFPTPIPVHLTYQTAFVDQAGKLALRDDIYGRDARVIAGLKSEERRVAETPAPAEPRRAASTGTRRQVYRTPPQQQYGGGFGFFRFFR